MGFADTWELVGNHTTNTINIHNICSMKNISMGRNILPVKHLF